MIKQYDVICPHCCGCFHETNGHFAIDKPAKGHMFVVKQHVADAGWTCFPPYDSTEYMDLVCPSCGQPYVESLGKVIRLQEIGEIEAASNTAYLNDIMDRLMDEYEPEAPADPLRTSALGTAYAEAKPPTTKRRGRPPKGE